MYVVLKADEDGRPARAYTEGEMKALLADPMGEAGIHEFKDRAWLMENDDPNYWQDGVAVVLRAEVVVPEPAGAYVLP